jgi:hypothetical protein
VHTDPQTPSDPYDVTPEAERPDRRPAIAALVVGGLALVVAVAIQPSIVEGGSGSVQAVLIAAVLGLLFVGFVVLAFRLVRQPVLLAAVVGLPLLVMAAVLGYTALVDDEADDEVAQELVTELADAEGEGDAVDPSAADEEAEAAADAPPTGPVRLTTGTFQGLDDHAASGSASLVEQPDGSQVVLFEDFEVERGPDYLVYLVPGDATFDASAGVEIAPLQGNVGDQQYAVPADLVGEQPLTVLIWCRAFDVNIAGAVLV